MKKPILVIMAAGMGSRYGGLKQMDPIGSCGQVILDYSIYDARRAGFETVVFVIKHELEADFKQRIGARIERYMDVRYAFQRMDDLPEGYSIPEGRVKPWGTAQAALAARPFVDGPFAILNADDYYGPEAFRVIYDHLCAHPSGDEYAMVAYRLENTVTDYGHVARGVCQVGADGYLTGIVERTRIEKGPPPPLHRGRRGDLDHPSRGHHGVHELLGLHPLSAGAGPGAVPPLPGPRAGRKPHEGGISAAHPGGPAHSRGAGPRPRPVLRGQVVRRHLQGGQAQPGRRHRPSDGRRALP